jgi:ribonuclease BN (tRNA processing enzyme)
MKITFLGTNGWYDTKNGNTICTLIETDDYFIVLDAGNGIYKLDQYIKNSNKPIYLFLSHFHIDHIEGLHILNKFNFSQGIKIYGQTGTINILKNIINEPYTVPFDKLPFKVEINELDIENDIPFKIEGKHLIHSTPCLGYRFEVDGKIIAYCTDTGICENAFKLAENADIVIAECSFKLGQENEEWPHLNPKDAAKIANESKAKKLALTHFDANVYGSLEERAVIEEKIKDIFKNIIIAYDDMEIIL